MCFFCLRSAHSLCTSINVFFCVAFPHPLIPVRGRRIKSRDNKRSSWCYFFFCPVTSCRALSLVCHKVFCGQKSETCTNLAIASVFFMHIFDLSAVSLKILEMPLFFLFFFVAVKRTEPRYNYSHHELMHPALICHQTMFEVHKLNNY